MNFDDIKMPSGNNYGTAMNWATVDGGYFIVAFFAKGNPLDPKVKDEFTWVIETNSGNVVYIDHKQPSCTPIFGLDEKEWFEFKEKAILIIDEYIKSL